MTELDPIDKWLIKEHKAYLKTNIDYILDTKPVDLSKSKDHYIEGIMLVDIEEFNNLGFKGGIHQLVHKLDQHFSALQKPIKVEVYNSKKCRLMRNNNGDTIISSEPISDLDGHTIIIRHLKEIKSGRRSPLPEEHLLFLQQSISKEKENLEAKKRKNLETAFEEGDAPTEEQEADRIQKIIDVAKIRREG